MGIIYSYVYLSIKCLLIIKNWRERERGIGGAVDGGAAAAVDGGGRW